MAIVSPYLLRENESNDESDLPKNVIDDNIFKTFDTNKKSANSVNSRGKGNHRRRNARN